MAQTPLRPYTPLEERIASVAVKAMSAVNIVAYRMSGGRIGGKFLRGAQARTERDIPVVILTPP